ncbi:MAG TPA: response regulator transcription factor [Methylomirabilota bacterium]|nr:response regulator transcription factor [Methylomirabilota bacterium]
MSKRTPPTVYVVDDDASVLKSLGRMLRRAGFAVECFSSGRDFLAHPPPPGPSCMILDVRMPQLDGLELQASLAARGCPPAIVFISGSSDIPISVRAMKAGAVDFLTKPYSTDELLDAVRRAVARSEVDQARHARSEAIAGRMRTLSRREAEVLSQVVTGRLNKQIAGELGITEKTVKVHRARVMRKMQADSVADLVRMGEVLGVRPSPEEHPSRAPE